MFEINLELFFSLIDKPSDRPVTGPNRTIGASSLSIVDGSHGYEPSSDDIYGANNPLLQQGYENGHEAEVGFFSSSFNDPRVEPIDNECCLE